MTPQQAAEKIQSQFGDAVTELREFRGEYTLIVDRKKIVDICKACRDELDFDFLSDICSVDNMGEAPRFEVVYHLYSYSHFSTLRIKATVPEDDAEIDTVSGIWQTAEWHEREVFDMMGITFRNHPDPRRILMWEGYPFHPLRKEFPLAGKPSEMPDVAFTNEAPMEGGPFVTSPAGDVVTREPRSRE